MSPKKLILLTAVVAALFAFIVLFERKMPTTADRERKGDLYWDIPAEKIDRLEISRGEEKVEFRRANGASWRMVRPQKYPAETFAVSGVVTDLAALRRSGGDGAEARPADFGLEKPVAVAVFEWADPDDPKSRKTRTVEFGSGVPGTDIVSARLAGTEKILFVPNSVLTGLQKNVDEFLSKDVFGGSASDVSRIEILRGRGRLVLIRKNGAWRLTEPVADLADTPEADRLAGQLTALRAREFVRGGVDLTAQGLNPSLFHVTVTDSKGAATAVDFGSTRSDGDSVYALREGQVLLVDREIMDDLSKETVAFRSSRLVEFNRSDVTALEGAFGPASFVLTQKDGGWSAGGHAILAGAADDLETALLDLKSSAFLEEADAKALPAPDATVTVKTKTGETWVLTFHARGEGVAAKVSGRLGAYGVEAGVPGQLEAAFRKAATPPPTPGPTKGKPAR